MLASVSEPELIRLDDPEHLHSNPKLGIQARTRYDQRPMGGAPSRFRRWILAALAGVVILVVVLVAIILAVFRFGALPLEAGTILGGGRVEAVVETMGPIAIGSYLIALENGGYALVDAGMDSEAHAIRSVLQRRDATAQDVRFIFVTHAHGDHMGGIPSFPAAEVYAIEADAEPIRRTNSRTVQGLADGDVVKASGTKFEVFAIPGHTPGSAAYLVYGVLFLGDSAAAAYDGSVQANWLFSEDSESNEDSLAALARRLQDRATEVQQIAFGHQGPVDGLGPLLKWASHRGLR